MDTHAVCISRVFRHKHKLVGSYVVRYILDFIYFLICPCKHQLYLVWW